MLNTQIHKPSSRKDVEGQNAVTTKVTAQKATESHDEVQKVGEGDTFTIDEVSEEMVTTRVKPKPCREIRVCATQTASSKPQTAKKQKVQPLCGG